MTGITRRGFLAGAAALAASPIVLGRTQDHAPLRLPWRVRNEHALMLGSSGSGKSTGITHYVNQAVALGENVILIDPHGNHPDSPYRKLQSCATSVIDFSSSRVVGFNPLACPEDTDPSVIVGNVMDALAIGWENESFTLKPTIERNLSAVIGALVELRLTLCEAEFILDRKDERGLRRHAIEKVKDPFTRRELQRLHDLAADGRRPRDYDQETIGTVNRLARLMRPPLVRGMLGQLGGNGLSIMRLLEERNVLLVNLAGGNAAYDTDADLFGRLLIRTILFHATRRRSRAPVNVVIDEAHRFFTPDIPRLLAGSRKYGVSLVMAMQWLDQADPSIQQAILKSTNIKMAFRLREAEEAERFARSIVPYDLERPVQQLIRPTLIGHKRTLMRNESDNESEAHTTSRASTEGTSDSIAHMVGESETYGSSTHEQDADSESETDGYSDGTSEQESEGEGGYPRPLDVPKITHVSSGASRGSNHSDNHAATRGRSRSRGRTDTESYSSQSAYTRSWGDQHSETEGEAYSQNRGRSRGLSEALEPILEDRPAAVHNITNEQYRAGLLLRSLPTGVAFVNFVGPHGPVATLVKVPEIRLPVSPPKVMGVPLQDALRRIDERHAALAAPKPAPQKPAKKPPPQRDHGEADYY